jgi:hypothetical protein
VCSIEESALRRVAEAIDQLEAARKHADSAHMEAQIAAIWAMVGELDPELARLVSGYANPAELAGAAAQEITCQEITGHGDHQPRMHGPDLAALAAGLWSGRRPAAISC